MPEHVLTLIAAETARGTLEHFVTTIAGKLGATNADWLAPRIACDLPFDGAPEAARDAARDVIGDAAIDAVVQKSAGRRKRLLLADLESTIIENEMLDEIADLLGMRERIAAITRRTMNGDVDFATALKQRINLFAGQPSTILARAAAHMRITPGARTLIATMNANRAKTILGTGGLHVFADEIRDALGFTRDYANEIVVDKGRLTGAVREPILEAANKRDILRDCAAEFGIAMEETLAVGDGANDLPMLHAAGLGIAFHPKPHVRDEIATRIEHTDLTSILFVQGYRATEFVG